MKIIGIEEHFLPGEVLAAWRTSPGGDDGTLGLNGGSVGERLADLGSGRLQLMDETGVDVQVLSVTTPGVNNLGRASVDLARRANDLAAGVVGDRPDRFQALAALPVATPEASAQELQRCVDELGFRGAIVYGRVGDDNLDHRRFWPTFEAAEALGVPLLIHPQIPTAAVRNAYYSGFADPATDLAFATFGLGWHYDAGIQFLRLALSGVFDRFPRLQVILGHWGEVVLFYLERLAMLDRVAGREHPIAQYVRENLYLTASGMFSHAYLQRAVDAVGPERILFSTDFPYQYRPGADARNFIDSLPSSSADREAFAHGNWDRLAASR
ncbi:amidohydrolase family protein [Microbacterium sp. PMB16]|uniref:amidohydrolase family protein n=1 Tax=Microbacterium sp. PMB16 TaxID=3120157 RepID=UPI003F4C1813